MVKKIKNKKLNIILILVLFLALIMIPYLSVSNQGNIENIFDEKDPFEIHNRQVPREASVYYEDTDGNARNVFVSGDFVYVTAGSFGLAIINISDPTNPGAPI